MPPRRAVRAVAPAGLRPAWIPAGLVIAWGAFLLLAFHPFVRSGLAPFPAGAAGVFAWANMLELAERVGGGHLVVVLWATAVAGLGRAVLPVVAPRLRLARPDRAAIVLGLGFGAGTLLWLGLGLTGLWMPVVAWTASAAGIWRALRAAAGGRRSSMDAATTGSVPAGPGRWAVFLFGALAVVSIAVLVAGTAVPETAADPLIYHLALPGIFVMEHRIVPVTQMFHGSLPMGAPMHYGWMLLLGGEPAVRAWRGWILVAILWLIHRLAAREGYGGAGWVAAGLFASLPQTHWLGSGTFVDMEACALGLVACLAVRAGGRRRTVLAGLLAGAGCAVKLTAVLLVPGLVFAAGRRTLRGIARRAVLAGLLVGVLLAPWWARNAGLVGNPVYPFAGGVFDAFRPMPAFNRALLARHTESRVLWNAGEWPVFPWRSAAGMNEETRLGPVFLLAVPWLVLWPPRGAFAAYAWVAGPAAACWAATTHIPRYGMAIWALGAVLIAAWLWDARRRRWLTIVGAGVLAVLGFDVVARSLPGTAGILPVWLGREPAHAVLDRMPNSYAGVARAARRLPGGARIILVGDVRGAHWPLPVVNHSPYDLQLAHEILASSFTPAEAAKRIRQRAGFVYVNDRESGRLKYTRDFPMLAFDARTERIAAGVWRAWMDEAVRDGDAVVWRVRRSPRRQGPWPAVPLTFDEAALRRAFGPMTSISYEAPGGGTTTIRLKP